MVVSDLGNGGRDDAEYVGQIFKGRFKHLDIKKALKIIKHYNLCTK